jgi:hypothetical protein
VTDYVTCLWCEAPAEVTITGSWGERGHLAHWPSCMNHLDKAVARVRADRAQLLGDRGRKVIDDPASVDAIWRAEP